MNEHFAIPIVLAILVIIAAYFINRAVIKYHSTVYVDEYHQQKMKESRYKFMLNRSAHIAALKSIGENEEAERLIHKFRIESPRLAVEFEEMIKKAGEYGVTNKNPPV